MTKALVDKIEDDAARFSLADRCYTLSVARSMSYRSISDLLKKDDIDISYGQVKILIDTYRKYLSKVRSSKKDDHFTDYVFKIKDLQQRYIAIANDVEFKRNHDLGKPQYLAQIQALNGYKETLVLEQALYGLEAPKETQVSNTGNVTFSFAPPEQNVLDNRPTILIEKPG